MLLLSVIFTFFFFFFQGDLTVIASLTSGSTRSAARRVLHWATLQTARVITSDVQTPVTHCTIQLELALPQ